MTKSRNVIIISLSFAVYFFSTLTINLTAPMIGSVKYVITLLLTSALFFYFSRAKEKIVDFISGNETPLKWLSITMFTLVHAANYEVGKFDWLTISSLLVVLTYYPFSAIILTRTRTEIGLAWSIALHSLTNSLMVIQVYGNDYLP